MESKTDTHHVREAVKDDCPQIMEFVKMLARHGNFEDTVTIDLDTLTRDAFPENEHPKFKCLVSLDDNNKYSGFLTYSDTYNLREGRYFFGLNIFVYSQFRRMGIGRKLFAEFARIALTEKISQIVFCILGWNKSSINFHESLGAVNLSLKEGLNIFQFDEKSIQNLANDNMEVAEATQHVREAVKDDCHQIMKLIKMADHNKNMEGSSLIDVETLIRDGFTENEIPKYKAIVSHDDNNQLSGYLVYNYSYLTYYKGQYISMKEIFIDPEFKRMEIGKSMLTKLAQIAVADNISQIFFDISNPNQFTIDLLDSLGAVNLTEKSNYYLFGFDEKSIQQLAIESKHF